MAALAVFQPDMSVALAAVCGLGLSLAFGFQRSRFVAFLASAAALGIAAMRPDRLDPVPFVENVLQDAVQQGGWPSLVLPLALIAATAAPLLQFAGNRREAAALSGWLFGLAAASLLGPFPTPLIGYGAAPIIGYGIAFGLLGPARAANRTQN